MKEVLTENIDFKQVAIAKEWLQKFTKPRKTYNKEFTAYQLKHCAENSVGKDKGHYVSRESFIKAAIDLGYRVNKREFLNADYKLAKRHPEDSSIGKRA
mgnify:CR=1 FL=1